LIIKNTMITVKTRCEWASNDDPLVIEYHDREWGVPVHDDRQGFTGKNR
jgi:DNA-3-methyladenine glycosylase I